MFLISYNTWVSGGTPELVGRGIGKLQYNIRRWVEIPLPHQILSYSLPDPTLILSLWIVHWLYNTVYRNSETQHVHLGTSQKSILWAFSDCHEVCNIHNVLYFFWPILYNNMRELLFVIQIKTRPIWKPCESCEEIFSKNTMKAKEVLFFAFNTYNLLTLEPW